MITKGKLTTNIALLFAIINLLYLNQCMYKFLQQYSIGTYIGILSFFAWLLLVVISERNISVNSLKVLGPLIICFAILTFVNYFIAIDDIPNLQTDFNNMMHLIMLTCILLYYIREEYGKQRRTILTLWLMDTIVSSVYTVYRLQQIPELSRLLSTGNLSKYISGVSSYGVMTFSNAYSLMLFSMLLAFLLLGRKVKRLPVIVLIVLFFITNVYMSFSISIILSLLGYLIAVFVSSYKGKYGILWSILIVVAVVILFSSMGSILNNLVDIESLPFSVKEKISELIILFQKGDMSNTDLASRGNLYLTSFETVVSNMFLGKIVLGNGTIGRHSEILDMLASYGAIYFFLVATSFKRIVNSLRVKINNEYYSWYFFILLLFIALSFINTSLWAPTMECLVVIIPFVLIEQNEKEMMI